MFTTLLFFGAVVPAAAAGLLALLLGEDAEREGRALPGAVAVGGAVAAAFLAAFAAEDLSAPKSWHWILWAAAACAVLGLLRGRPTALPLRALAAAGLAAAASAIQLGRLVPHALDAGQVALHASGVGLGAGLAAIALGAAARSLPERSLAPALAAWAGATAGLMFELGSARLGQITGFAAAATGALALLAWLLPRRRWLRGAELPLVVVLAATGVNAYHFGYDVAAAPLLLAAAGPLLLAGGSRLRALHDARPLVGAASCALLAALPVLAGFLLALRLAAGEADGGGELPY